jgi:hypothetical protein
MLEKKTDRKLNPHLPIFTVINFDGLLENLDQRIEAIEAGEAGEVTMTQVNAAITAGTADIETAIEDINTEIADINTEVAGKVTKAIITALTPEVADFADLAAATTAHNAVIAKLNEIIAALD